MVKNDLIVFLRKKIYGFFSWKKNSIFRFSLQSEIFYQNQHYRNPNKMILQDDIPKSYFSDVDFWWQVRFLSGILFTSFFTLQFFAFFLHQNFAF